MSLTLRCATVLSGADIEIKTPGPLKILGQSIQCNIPPLDAMAFHVTEDRVATRGSHLTDLSDFYLSDMRRPRVVGMEWGSTHVGVISEDD